MAVQTVDYLDDIEASYEVQPGPLSPVVNPASLTIHTPYGTINGCSIYYWDERVSKSRYFDFGDFLGVRDVDDILGTDVGIIPNVWGDIRMRDHADNNGIWPETLRIMRGRGVDKDLQIPGPSFRSSATPSCRKGYFPIARFSWYCHFPISYMQTGGGRMGEAPRINEGVRLAGPPELF